MCGCKKNGVNRSTGRVIRPTSSFRSTPGGIASAPSPTQLRSQSLNSSAIDSEKRKTQNIRRDAIKRSLNK